MPKHILFALIAVCLILPGCSESPTDPGDSAVDKDRIEARVTSASSEHDCDPNQTNPGDFSAYVKLYADVDGKWVLCATSKKGSFTIDSESDTKTKSFSGSSEIKVSITAPRVSGNRVRVEAYMEEHDSGSVDSRLVGTTDLVFDDDLRCWRTTNGSRCQTGSYATSRTFREDEFHLFNPDDEGCQMTVRWGIATFAAN